MALNRASARLAIQSFAHPRERVASVDTHPLVVLLAIALGLAFLLTAFDVGGHASVWEIAHWTIAAPLAALITFRGAQAVTGHERSLRLAIAASLVLWGMGQMVWNVQAAFGWYPVPAPDDAFFVASIVPAVWAFASAGKRHLRAADLVALRIDALIVLVACATLILAAFGREAVQAGGWAGLILLFYPIGFMATAGAGVVSALARRARASTWLVLAGAALQGVAWIAWLPMEIRNELVPGTGAGYLFSISLLLVGIGGARWPGRPSRGTRTRQASAIARDVLPIAAVVAAMTPILAMARDELGDAAAICAGAVVALALTRQSLLSVDRLRRMRRERLSHQRELAAETALYEAARLRSADATWLANLRPGRDLDETLAMLCAEVIAVPAWEAAGVVAIDAEGVLEALISVGNVPPALEASAAMLGRVPPADSPWIGRLSADDPRKLVVATLHHDDSSVGLLWALPFEGTTDAWLQSRRSTMVEFAAFASAFAGADLFRRRSAQRLRRAIEQVIADRAFAPIFQPVVDLTSRRVIGYEALTRFDDGIRPDRRFADAAEVGLGVVLEATTLRSAFAAARGLPAGIWLSVNVSPQLLLAVMPLVAALEGVDVDLVLELTEHVAIDDYGRLREAIALLGTRADVSIDDAGSGYASLRHILELGPRYVKLDISLVRSIETDAARQAIVAGLVHFATTTGVELIAEGIETEPQLEALRALGIRLGQGYLLGRPGPFPERPGA